MVDRRLHDMVEGWRKMMPTRIIGGVTKSEKGTVTIVLRVQSEGDEMPPGSTVAITVLKQSDPELNDGDAGAQSTLHAHARDSAVRSEVRYQRTPTRRRRSTLESAS